MLNIYPVRKQTHIPAASLIFKCIFLSIQFFQQDQNALGHPLCPAGRLSACLSPFHTIILPPPLSKSSIKVYDRQQQQTAYNYISVHYIESQPTE